MGNFSHRFLQPVVSFFFFGNFFYGCCAVALSIETLVQLLYSPISITYCLIVFVSTCLYYSIAYLTDTVTYHNERSIWYTIHRKTIIRIQWVFGAILLICLVSMGNVLLHSFQVFTLFNIITLLSFPFFALAYYGIGNGKANGQNFRNTGWLKPFVIGYVWAGLVTVYPIAFYDVQHNLPLTLSSYAWILFLQNFLFISALCILFDIKDYTDDYNQQIKTLIVRWGVVNTIRFIVIPLAFASYCLAAFYGYTHHYHSLSIIIQSIPFILSVWVAWEMNQHKNIMFYLIIIDGLMLIKAIVGIISNYY